MTYSHSTVELQEQERKREISISRKCSSRGYKIDINQTTPTTKLNRTSQVLSCGITKSFIELSPDMSDTTARFAEMERAERALQEHLAHVLIDLKFFSQDGCPQAGIVQVEDSAWTPKEFAKINALMLKKHRLVIMQSTPGAGSIAALFLREKKKLKWTCDLVFNSSELFASNSRFDKEELVRDSDSVMESMMEAQIEKLGFEVDLQISVGTKLAVRAYPSNYDRARVGCDIVECVALVFLHMNEDELVEHGIEMVRRQLEENFSAIAVIAAKTFARK